MAEFTTTVNDLHVPRIVNAINGFYPEWEIEHPTFTIKDMVEYLVKQNYLKDLVQKWEKLELSLAMESQASSLPDLS